MSPLLPSRPCHWKPKSAALSPRDLDDHAFDVDLRAARVELVDHRAHLAVERLGRGDDQRVGRRVGLDEAAGRRPGRRRQRRGRCADAPPLPCRLVAVVPPRLLVAVGVAPSDARCCRRPPPPLAPPAAALKAARSTVASLRRVGVLQVDDPDVAARRRRRSSGRSSLSTSARTMAMRAGFGARTISELLRESTRIDGAAAGRRRRAGGAPGARRRLGQALHQRREVGRRPRTAAGSPRRRRRRRVHRRDDLARCAAGCRRSR